MVKRPSRSCVVRKALLDAIEKEILPLTKRLILINLVRIETELRAVCKVVLAVERCLK